MKIQKVAQMVGGQDGTIWGDYVFRFDAGGNGWVLDARPLDTADGTEIVELPLLSAFRFGQNDPLVPHCNAVVFGTEYFAPDDEFPLLYLNVYNNYIREADRKEGICCVYRVLRNNNEFSLTLVQLIRIGFVKDLLWISGGGVQDFRPFGNFVIDREKKMLYAFTMRDKDRTARYFSFDLPKLSDGEMSEEYGVPVVTLQKEDVKEWFDTEYHVLLQGACCHNGLIYSSEGCNSDLPPAQRVIDPAKKRQIHHTNLMEIGYREEAEFIDFRNGVCYYSDADGNTFRVEFFD